MKGNKKAGVQQSESGDNAEMQELVFLIVLIRKLKMDQSITKLSTQKLRLIKERLRKIKKNQKFVVFGLKEFAELEKEMKACQVEEPDSPIQSKPVLEEKKAKEKPLVCAERNEEDAEKALLGQKFTAPIYVDYGGSDDGSELGRVSQPFEKRDVSSSVQITDIVPCKKRARVEKVEEPVQEERESKRKEKAREKEQAQAQKRQKEQETANQFSLPDLAAVRQKLQESFMADEPQSKSFYAANKPKVKEAPLLDFSSKPVKRISSPKRIYTSTNPDIRPSLILMPQREEKTFFQEQKKVENPEVQTKPAKTSRERKFLSTVVNRLTRQPAHFSVLSRKNLPHFQRVC